LPAIDAADISPCFADGTGVFHPVIERFSPSRQDLTHDSKTKEFIIVIFNKNATFYERRV
jgi:hypothetical protein